MPSSVAIITGASQGIGRAAAARPARDFPALVLVARNRANLEETAALARKVDADARIIDADLSQAPSAPSMPRSWPSRRRFQTAASPTGSRSTAFCPAR
jgi:short-subunit dehydrogenase